MSQTPDGAGDSHRLKKVPSGIAGLDVILKGGFLQGGITIVQGKPGVGKTILGNQLCFNHAAAGGRALYVTLLAETHTRMLLHIGDLGFFQGDIIPDQLSYLSAFAVLESEGIRGLLTVLRQEVRSNKATLLVLDGLVAAEKAAGSDMEFKKFIHELQTQATIADCAMFLLTSGSDDPGLTTAEHTMVDCVVEMRTRVLGWRAERDLEIMKRRGDGFIRGRHSFRISDAGITVFPRFEALFATPTHATAVDSARAGTGLSALDDMFAGGLPLHSNTLLMGPAGSGKTTLGLHFLSQCTADEPGLYFGFYEAIAGIRAKAQALGLSLHDHFGKGTVEFLWQPTTEAILDETCANLLSTIRARGVRRLFFDGLGGLEKLTDESSRLKHILTALANELRGLQVTSLFTKESEDLLGGFGALSGSSLSPGGVSDIADNIVLLQFIRLRSRFHRSVMVFKARDSRISDQMRLFEITQKGIVIDDNPDRAEALFTTAAGPPGTGDLSPDTATRDKRGT